MRLLKGGANNTEPASYCQRFAWSALVLIRRAQTPPPTRKSSTRTCKDVTRTGINSAYWCEGATYNRETSAYGCKDATYSRETSTYDCKDATYSRETFTDGP